MLLFLIIILATIGVIAEKEAKKEYQKELDALNLELKKETFKKELAQELLALNGVKTINLPEFNKQTTIEQYCEFMAKFKK